MHVAGRHTLTTTSVLTRCARLPMTTAALCLDSSLSISSQSSSKSSNRLAPSASTISRRRPLPCSIPCFTAPPFPTFFDRDTTRMSHCECSRAYWSATSGVPSFEPSSTMRTSQVRLLAIGLLKCPSVWSSIVGNRRISLNAGTITLRSSSGGEDPMFGRSWWPSPAAERYFRSKGSSR